VSSGGGLLGSIESRSQCIVEQFQNCLRQPKVFVGRFNWGEASQEEILNWIKTNVPEDWTPGEIKIEIPKN